MKEELGLSHRFVRAHKLQLSLDRWIEGAKTLKIKIKTAKKEISEILREAPLS